jgi:hemolysin activation/secretion protein
MNIFRHHRDPFALRRCCAWRKDTMIVGLLVSSVAWLCWPGAAAATPESPPVPAAGRDVGISVKGKDDSNAVAQTQTEQHFYIQEYRVEGGGHLLPRIEVEAAVYPYLGPYRTTADVEQARGALEQAYRNKGYQTVSVQIPQQKGQGGVIVLNVVQGEVGRLRVHGSRYFSIEQIKREAPSLQEGQSPNFSQVTHDLLVLNGLPDRRVTPAVHAGETPGTVDVDLNVKDTPPIHGSLEINNRYSADTTPLRINGSVSYDNLWQLEHSISFSFQVSPEDITQVKVFSGYYLARIPDVSWLTLMLQGTKQDSNVNTLGGIGVAGKGDVLGGRAIISLPQQKDFYHSVSLGLDYKHFTQDVLIAGTDATTPVTYYPVSAAYSGTWVAKGYETDLNASVNLALRGTGSDEADFELNRHGASGDFIYFRGDLSHTRDLPEGFQLFVKAQGQAADQPLLNSEQFSGGGLGTVRGLLESEVLGDNGLLGSIELRSPSLGELLGKTVDEWRFYIFSDGGILTVDDPLIETPYQYNLVSVGAGTRIKMLNHLNGSLDLGIPLVVDSIESSVPSGAYAPNPIREHPYDAALTFRVWGDF